MNGFLLLDKPQGMTSFTLVKRVRRALGVKKAGHCGTLDPLATGLMIICLGRATKLARFVTAEKKTYLVEIMLGAESTTYDRDGDITPVAAVTTVTEMQIRECLSGFRGKIQQKPPAYSAIKYRGQPLYKYARRNQPIEPDIRQVVIEKLDLQWFAAPRLCLSLTCSKGTYVRSLAHDLGQRLGCGAYVDALRRTAVGTTEVDQAVSLETLEQLAAGGQAEQLLMSMGGLLSLPSVYLKAEAAARVVHGAEIRGVDITGSDQPLDVSQVVALRDRDGLLLAVGKSLLPTGEPQDRQQARAIEYIRVI